MDFGFSEEQQDLQGLAKQILEGELSNERLKEVEPAATGTSTASCGRKLAEAGIARRRACPRRNGGGGYGFLEAALVLEQVGRTVAPVPYLATVVLGGAADRAVRLRRAEGRVPARRHRAARRSCTAALVEVGHRPARTQTTATRDGDGWVLDGMKDCVPAGLARRQGARARRHDRRRGRRSRSSTRPRAV